MSDQYQEPVVGTPDASERSSLTLTDGDLGLQEIPSRHITIQMSRESQPQASQVEGKDYQTTAEEEAQLLHVAIREPIAAEPAQYPRREQGPVGEDEPRRGRSAEGPQSVAILADRLRITATVADILQRHTLLLKLAKALVRYGAPSHRVVGHIILLKVVCFEKPSCMELLFCSLK
ncbi:hypothetical protein BC936DRAFT_144739 [Jimgerdemannia flammicorona]|uniref:Uncharacterized protein n=1 Tax=Jimgerdemannia flammicorona TaxID=994334 RepID=A0A433DBS8_9FUNG|nr:hypothetical protein BC936DRAFT_144739 [Jimgerdemannia flammicorona]